MLSVLHDKGNQHESEMLTTFEASGLTIANLHKRTDSYQATLDAMKNGVDIIYQAHLELLPFRGDADFLIKVKGESIFGDYCYEVWDTKISMMNMFCQLVKDR